MIANLKANFLQSVLYISYLIWLRGDFDRKVGILIDSSSKLNAMITAFAAILGFLS